MYTNMYGARMGSIYVIVQVRVPNLKDFKTYFMICLIDKLYKLPSLCKTRKTVEILWKILYPIFTYIILKMRRYFAYILFIIECIHYFSVLGCCYKSKCNDYELYSGRHIPNMAKTRYLYSHSV